MFDPNTPIADMSYHSGFEWRQDEPPGHARSGQYFMEVVVTERHTTCYRTVAMTTTPNQNYRLYFSLYAYVPNNWDCLRGISAEKHNEVKVHWGSTNSEMEPVRWTYDGVRRNDAWEDYYLDITAPGLTLYVAFCGNSPLGCGSGSQLDRVELRQVVKSGSSNPAHCRKNKCAHIEAAQNWGACATSSLCEEQTLSGKRKCIETYCSRIEDEMKCQTDPLCNWDTSISPSACTYTYCGKYPTSDKCHADAQCSWDSSAVNGRSSNKGVCVLHRCHMETSECKCWTHNECFWSAETSQCRDERCYNCPNLDIVIALDGSKSLNAKFAHYENGYQTLVEELRLWAEDLTMSGVTGATDGNKGGNGIRLSVIQYGLEDAVQADSSAAAFRGTSFDTEFMLDWHAQRPMNADGKYVEPALKKAFDMFAQSEGREK
eukprot:PhM_4_TR5178/c0_g1_i1/m.27040